MSPRFSVIIPTYNRADLIMETLQTVFDQRFKDYEIIVVDNHSTDETESMMRALETSGRLRYIRNDRNYERSHSRNVGLRSAKGEYVTFLDSDDFMYEDFLADADAFAREHPEIKIFQSKYETVDRNRKKVYDHRFPSLDNQYKALSDGNFIACIAGVIHRDVYTDVSFSEDPRMIASEDYEVWFHILARHKMGRINKINAGIREHEQRSVNNGAYDNLEYQKKYILQKIKGDPVLAEKFGRYLPRIAATFTLQQIVSSYHARSKTQLFSLLLKTVAIDPAVLATSRFYKVLYNIIKS